MKKKEPGMRGHEGHAGHDAHAGHEGHEGHEGREGHEGHEGHGANPGVAVKPRKPGKPKADTTSKPGMTGMDGMEGMDHGEEKKLRPGAPSKARELGLYPMSLWSDCPAQHAFVMCGEKALFLAHLTMFHMEEHCYQMVLRVRLGDAAMKTYRDDRKKHPQACYFLGNTSDDPLDMPDFNSGRRKAFIGDVFRGIPQKEVYASWPWQGEQPLVPNTLVTIDRVVYYRHFDFNLAYPPNQTYIMFGEGDEAFLDHYQTKEPDFDEVIALKRAPKWVPPSLLEAGLHVNFPNTPTQPTPCRSPIKPGERRVQYGQQPLREIEIDRSLWFSTKVLNGTDPCGNPPYMGPTLK